MNRIFPYDLGVPVVEGEARLGLRFEEIRRAVFGLPDAPNELTAFSSVLTRPGFAIWGHDFFGPGVLRWERSCIAEI